MEKYHHRYRYFLIVAILTMVGIMVMLISKDSSVLNVNSVETENELKKEVPAIALLAGDEQPGFFCRFVKEWGNYGTGDGQFTNPYSIAFDNQRNVYVAENDLNNIRRIQKFDSDGNFLLKWTSTTDKWEEVNGIAIDKQNNVYVAAYRIGWLNSTISKFDLNGNLLLKWTVPSSQLASIEVDNQGNIYVVDKSMMPERNVNIQKFDSDGNFLLKWGGLGINDGQFIAPEGIAVDNANKVYVSDGYSPFSGTAKYDVQKFDSQGNFIKKLTGFKYPINIAVDHLRRLYVLDSLDRNVKVFSEDGALLTTFGSYGTGNGQFMQPRDIAAGFDNVYVTDRANYSIQKFECTITPIQVNHCSPHPDKNMIQIRPVTCLEPGSALEV